MAIEELVTWFESHCEDLTGSAAVASHLGPGPVRNVTGPREEWAQGDSPRVSLLGGHKVRK